MEIKRNAELLVALLLNSEEVKLVAGGYDPGHAQNGAPYSQNGTCPGGYTQLGGAGGYTQSCPV
jgi:hypothetical protein